MRSSRRRRRFTIKRHVRTDDDDGDRYTKGTKKAKKHKRKFFLAFLCLFVVLIVLFVVRPTVSLLSAAIARHSPPQVWIGIGIRAEKDVPAIEGTTAKSGLRITRLSFNSPADKAGLIIDDLIIGAEGRDFTAESSALERQFPEFILQHAPGDSITLRVVRDRKLIDIRIIVEERPEQAPVKEYSSPKIEWPEEHLAGALIDVFNVRESYEDLRRRLERLSKTGDGFRLSRVAYVQREPFQLRRVAEKTLDQLAAAVKQRNPQKALQ